MRENGGVERGGRRTGQSVHDLHDGEGLGDARKVVDHQRHEGRPLPPEHDGDTAEDGGPGDGGGGIVENEVGLFGAEAGLFGHLGVVVKVSGTSMAWSGCLVKSWGSHFVENC